MEQLREYYQSQHTDVLLDIARKDILDEARVVLTEVLASRGVSPEQVDEAKKAGLLEQATAAAEANRLGSRMKRLLAFAIDVWGVMLILLAVLFPLRLLSVELHANIVTIVWLAYFMLRDGIPGQGIGKRALGLRVVHEKTGKACRWSQSIFRNLLHIVFFLDALFVLNRRRMRLGDMAASTIVINRSVPNA